MRRGRDARRAQLTGRTLTTQHDTPLAEGGKLRRDIVWNLASVAVLAVCGIAINTLIGRYFGADWLGAFNQILAVYVITSQLSVGGFGYSTLALSAEHSARREDTGAVVIGALLLVFTLSVIVSVVVFMLASAIGALLDSARVASGIRVVAPLLILFAINKILLLTANGLRLMVLVACAQSLRYIAMLIVIISLSVYGGDGEYIVWCLAAAELAVLPVACYFVAVHCDLPSANLLSRQISEHCQRGYRGFFSGLLQDTNSRVDVIVLGAFTSDRVVGIYSFAAMLAEGVLQMIVVVQSNLSPILTRLWQQHFVLGTYALFLRTSKLLIPAMLAVSVLGSAAYIPVVELMVGSSEFASGWLIFLILTFSIGLCASLIAFATALNQFGRPGLFSLYLAAQVVVNVLLNLALIPTFGPIGAATATGIAWIVSSIVMWRLLKKAMEDRT